MEFERLLITSFCNPSSKKALQNEGEYLKMVREFSENMTDRDRILIWIFLLKMYLTSRINY